jgi:hypothetical protein
MNSIISRIIISRIIKIKYFLMLFGGNSRNLKTMIFFKKREITET